MLANPVLIAALSVLIGSSVLGARTSITGVGQNASVIMIGQLTGAENGTETGQLVLTLSVMKPLKGQIYTPTILAGLAPGYSDRPPQELSRSLFGRKGIWFLSQGGSGYQVIRMGTDNLPGELFLPLSDSLAAASFPGTVEQQLLQYLVGWYRSLPNPTVRDDMQCLGEFQSSSAAPEDLLAAANSLIGSPVVASQVVGLAAAIGLGSDSAVSALSSLLNTVGSSPKFYLIRDALAIAYQPHGVASIPALKQIIDQHSAAEGIDAAAAAALAKVVDKQTLPVMAELLKSGDATAQLRAARFFGVFSLFADSNGSVSGGGPVGPFATDQTRRYTPGRDSGITPQEYSQFWQQWWARNRTLLGL